MLRGIVVVVVAIVIISTGSSIGEAGVARILVGKWGEGMRRGLAWGVGEGMKRNLVMR